ncbi:UrcA family protein [Aurantiacibacter hainanensis]|uniref:UrcA family protein n=1 Tax=Aurantiacibacter hainanensis TaxID=3076114 RepID=UPI0030C7559B
MTKTFTFAAAAIAAAIVSSPAAADDQFRSANVTYADLGLTRDAGVDSLDTRIRMAVNRVCATSSSPDRSEMRWERNCRLRTMEQVVVARDEAVRIARGGAAARPELASLSIALPTAGR